MSAVKIIEQVDQPPKHDLWGHYKNGHYVIEKNVNSRWQRISLTSIEKGKLSNLVFDSNGIIDSSILPAQIFEQADWNQEDPTQSSYIKNKPTIPEQLVAGNGILIEDNQIKIDTSITADIEYVETVKDSITEATDQKMQEERVQRVAAEEELDNKITTINSKIPAEASATNQLADKEFVIDSIPQSDWNQNDDTQKDYIKNRICYEKNTGSVINMLGTTLHTDSNSELVEKNFNGAFGFNPPIPLEPNVEYTLTIGDVSLPVILSGSADSCAVYNLPHPNCNGQIIYSRHGVWGSSDYTALIMFSPDWQRLYPNKEIKLELRRGSSTEIKTIEKKWMPEDTTYQQDLLASAQDINDIVNN